MVNVKTKCLDVMTVIDYACVSFETDETDIRLAAFIAEKYGIKTILVNPIHISILKKFCEGKDINVASTAAYPVGAYPPELKRKEIAEIVDKGVDEIYMLMAVGVFLDGNYAQIEEEMNVMVDAAKGRVTKYIIESGLLNDNQKEQICRMAYTAGIDYIVTSANFVPNKISMPSLEDIRVLSEKAAGKIDLISFCDVYSIEQVEELINMGVSRICTGNLFEII